MSARYFIMGANGGAGEALARKLHDQGHAVALSARDQSSLSDLAHTLNAPAYSVDVTQADTVTAAINDIAENDGLCGLAYCIGSIDIKPFKSTKDDDFTKSFDLNVLGAIRTLQAAEAQLKKNNGSVVLFSTIAVQQGFPNHSIISSSKGAIEGLVRALAAEWAPKVRVNGIAPSLSKTGIAEKLTSSEAMATQIANLHPIPRLGEPQDLASAAAWLLTEESSWVSGQIIHVDGGRSHIRTKG